ncbi:hypothetical protein CMO91_06330 [Candidatus Woesearchaeota archaeon]|nr:hypothetical protein [Candidatus Woesearchaeota archaeon]
MAVSEAFARKAYEVFCRNWVPDKDKVSRHEVTSLTAMAEAGAKFMLWPQERTDDSCLHVVCNQEPSPDDEPPNVYEHVRVFVSVGSGVPRPATGMWYSSTVTP